MKRERIREYKAGDRIVTGRMNQLVRSARRDISGEPPILVHSMGDSWQITHAPHTWDWFPAKILNSSSDFSDQRYRVRPQFITNSDTDASDLLTWSDAGTVPSDLDVVAVHLGEDGTHTLEASDMVIVYRQEDKSSPSGYRHFIAPQQEPGFWARLTARESDQTYSWVKLEADASTPADPEVTGELNAQEVNSYMTVRADTSGDSDGTVVWMRSTGASDQYRFAYEPSGFWAWLTECPDDTSNFYSWERLDENAYDSYSPEITGSRSAKEVNLVRNAPVSETRITGGTVVWMWSAGYEDFSDTGYREEFRFIYPGGLDQIVGGPGIVIDDTTVSDEIKISVDLEGIKPGLQFIGEGDAGELAVLADSDRAIGVDEVGVYWRWNSDQGLSVSDGDAVVRVEGADFNYTKSDADGWIGFSDGIVAHGDPQSVFLDTATDLP